MISFSPQNIALYLRKDEMVPKPIELRTHRRETVATRIDKAIMLNVLEKGMKSDAVHCF